MTNIENALHGPDSAATTTERRPWVAPELRTMRAGSAEAGPNPVVPEGAFAQGS